MTRALVVFESMFGNTEVVARAIAEGLSDKVSVRVARAGPDLLVDDDVELLVVGGPTHAFGLTRPGTRGSAGQQGASIALAKGIGVREWLDGLGSTTARVAAFDTRVHKPGLPGSAARGAEKRLGRAGARVLAPATSFWVTSTQGPLLPGEEDRARQWGNELGLRLLLRTGARTSG
jgi:hypothetical protein